MTGGGRRRVRLTATAESDFRNILRWTAERFGHAQARKGQDRIDVQRYTPQPTA